MSTEEKRENDANMSVDTNDNILEKRIVRKTDFFLLRNATVAGYNYIYFKTTPYYFTLAISAHFLSYIIFTTPSCLITNILGFHVWMPILIVGWTAASMSQAACTRMFEAGFPPSNTAYIGLFYARKELTFRYSIFMVITTISGALSGFVSYFILQISGTSLTGFQWLFIIENIPTIFLALIIAIFVTRGPGDARFFTPEEREFAVERLKSEGGPTKRVDRDLAKAQIKLTFADIQTYFYFFIVLISAIPNFVLNFYLPTLVNQLGYDAIQAQLMVIPPILVSTVVTTFNSWCSDRYNTRAWNILIGYSFSIIALVGMIATRADDPIGQYKRSTALAMIFTSAQMGGIVGILIYPANDAPSFLMGNSICLASVILSAILVTVLKFYLESLNKKRDLIILANHDYKLNDNDLKYNNRIREIAMSLVEKEPKFDEVLCDKHLNWRYIT
ncbi:9118_t:CDS:2 [Gigaspora margarita]|uniref:9118_t:CDS:1 n=1 Tax=Gigaspora margarita TaxID=4874 RepID=A0ABN7UL96_GIGMA|nr:9118_t:CDS:2 [Gigaspora margarita]